MQVAVDELDRDVPLLEIVDDQPRHHHSKVRPAGQMPERAVDDHVDMLVFDGVRLKMNNTIFISVCRIMIETFVFWLG